MINDIKQHIEYFYIKKVLKNFCISIIFINFVPFS